jgi:hypothetical protein
MFTDPQIQARAEMHRLRREAHRSVSEGELRRMTTIERPSQRLRFPVPEWLKRSPILRTTFR